MNNGMEELKKRAGRTLRTIMKGLGYMALLITCMIQRPLTGLAQQYSQITGWITQQNSGHQPIVNARVSATAALPTTTDSSGRFVLHIDRRICPNEIYIKVDYEGWELVNPERLHYPFDTSTQSSIHLYMCPLGEWERNAVKYYTLTKTVIEEAYYKQLVHLQERDVNSYQQQLLLQEELVHLHQTYIETLTWALGMSEEFAKVNLDDMSPTYRHAFELFTQGNIDSAIQVLEPMRVANDSQKAIQTYSAALEPAKKAERYAKAAVLKARLHINKFQFSKAYDTYELAISIDSSNLYHWFEYAHVLQSQNHELKALPIYKHIVASEAIDQQLLTASFNNMGNIYRSLNQYDSALFFIQKANSIASVLHATTSSEVPKEKRALHGVVND